MWYASLPCFDIKNLTAKANGEKAILKYSEWKGKPVPCSAIFTSVPTDYGICCTFNMKAAEDLYLPSQYSQVIQERQRFDKKFSFADSSVPTWYANKSEPKAVSGRNKGLFLILDAHTDLLDPGSVNSDYNGFVGLVHPAGSFPVMSQGGFEIEPGHVNAVRVTASSVDSEDGMKAMDVEDRKCKMADETSGLKIYKNYSYSNCLFECSLLYARKVIVQPPVKVCTH
jgi:hypothetical protein